MEPGVTVLIPYHRARIANGFLGRAIGSVVSQTRPPERIHMYEDINRHGVGQSRRELICSVVTEWTAWIDSDDEWLPQHLDTLMKVAESAPDIAYVYSWFHGPDPLGHFGKPFNPCTPHHTTMGILERTSVAQEAGFCDTQEGPYSNEDWYHIVKVSEICCKENLRMVHIPERTWIYHQQGQNSSGKPGQGDA